MAGQRTTNAYHKPLSLTTTALFLSPPFEKSTTFPAAPPKPNNRVRSDSNSSDKAEERAQLILMSPQSVITPKYQAQPDTVRTKSAPPARSLEKSGLSPQQAVHKYRYKLTSYEKIELSKSTKIVWTIGTFRVHGSSTREDGTFRAHAGEQLGYRYEIKTIVGVGAFGCVVQCKDMKEQGRLVAVKMSKGGEAESDSAVIEAKLLKRIQRKEPEKHNLIKIYDSFKFRDHYFIVTEILDMNLYHYVS